MKSKKSRVVAKVFLCLAVLTALVMLAELGCYAMSEQWQLPLAIKYEYMMLTLGVLLIFLIITLWLLVLSRDRKEQSEIEEAEEETLLEACVADNYAVQRYGHTCVSKTMEDRPSHEKKRKSVAKIVLPIVGICAVCIAVAVIVKKRKK